MNRLGGAAGRRGLVAAGRGEARVGADRREAQPPVLYRRYLARQRRGTEDGRSRKQAQADAQAQETRDKPERHRGKRGAVVTGAGRRQSGLLRSSSLSIASFTDSSSSSGSASSGSGAAAASDGGFGALHAAAPPRSAGSPARSARTAKHQTQALARRGSLTFCRPPVSASASVFRRHLPAASAWRGSPCVPQPAGRAEPGGHR